MEIMTVTIDPRVDHETRGEVALIMDVLGLDGLQAYRHVQGRKAAMAAASAARKDAIRAPR